MIRMLHGHAARQHIAVRQTFNATCMDERMAREIHEALRLQGFGLHALERFVQDRDGTTDALHCNVFPQLNSIR